MRIKFKKEPFDWTCPFCERHATITSESINESTTTLEIKNADGIRVLVLKFIVCPNPKCKKFTLLASLCEIIEGRDGYLPGKVLKIWRLIPPSKAKSFPSYIPKAILNDYEEACLICDLSPKASATLSRRCLQGIIRDFWNVEKDNLKKEIEAIKDKVDPLTWDAIDSVRRVGNIGAHMEKDINLIVDVEPKEASLLIGLIETLLKDWYINREERKRNLEEIKKIADKKAQIKKDKGPNP